eukprot:scaffold8494_cov125-Isochrysis_galbana.AAC.8
MGDTANRIRGLGSGGVGWGRLVGKRKRSCDCTVDNEGLSSRCWRAGGLCRGCTAVCVNQV